MTCLAVEVVVTFLCDPGICGDSVGGPGETRGLVLVDITYVEVARAGGVEGTTGGFDCKLFCLMLVGGTLYCIVVPDGIVIV